MAKQEEIKNGLIGILAISNISVEAKLNFVLGFLHENQVVIKGQSLGFSHPHLVNYFTVEPLIEESK